jgi:hypothetical protein
LFFSCGFSAKDNLLSNAVTADFLSNGFVSLQNHLRVSALTRAQISSQLTHAELGEPALIT